MTAACLTALTLAVFAYSKDTGPESSVRRLHQAAAAGNYQQFKAVVAASTPDETTKVLYASLRNLMAGSVDVRLGRVTTEGRTAYVDVAYLSSVPGRVSTVRWVVVKPDLRWRVDARATLTLAERMVDF